LRAVKRAHQQQRRALILLLQTEKSEKSRLEGLTRLIYSLEEVLGGFLDIRRRVNVFNLQVKVDVLRRPNLRLKVEQAAAMKRNCHVGNHRDEIVRVRRRLAEAFVVVVITQHGDSLAAAARRRFRVRNLASEHRTERNSLLAVWISHVSVRTLNRNAAVAAPKICANVVSVAAHSRRLLALVDVWNVQQSVNKSQKLETFFRSLPSQDLESAPSL
jgi:hypothetical protein